MFKEMYSRLIKEARVWVDPHALANMRQIRNNNKVMPQYSNLMLYRAFAHVGRCKNEKIY